MAFNGSGLFVRVYNWITDRDNGVKIRADRFDAELDGMATGLSTCIAKDGQTTITADLPMNSKKFTGLAAGSAAGHSVRYEQIRERSTADRNYYVRTDGSDSNTGSANTAGAAFLTVQKAVTTALNTPDRAAFDVYINIADGTYNGSIVVSGFLMGSGTASNTGRLVIVGNQTTPDNVVLNYSSGNTLTFQGCRVDLYGVKVTSSAIGVFVNESSSVGLRKVNFGACTNGDMEVGIGSTLTLWNNYTKSGNSLYHMHAPAPGIVTTDTITCTLSGTPAFGAYFAGTSNGGQLDLRNITYSGAATGKRFAAHQGGVILPPSASYTALPGDTAGTRGAGGIYNMGDIDAAVGTITNDAAQTGDVGEHATANATGVSVTTVTAKTITSVSLTAGDWDVSGVIVFIPAGTTTVTDLLAEVSVTNNTASNGLGNYSRLGTGTTITPGGRKIAMATPVVRQSLSTPTTIYLVGYAEFGTSTMTADALIRARRVR